MRLRPFIYTALAVILISCEKNFAGSQFIKVSDAPEGVYRFDVDLSDSLSTYDISFYSRRLSGPLMLDVNWISPASVSSLRDSVWMEPTGGKAALALYRSGVCPKEKGLWVVEVRISSVPEHFCGLGIVSKKNGTR